MAQVLSDPEVRRLTGSVESTAEARAPQPVDDRLRDWYATRNDQADRLDLAIDDARPVGSSARSCSTRSTVDALTCNLRVLVGPEGRDRGLGTEAVGLATAYGIEVLGPAADLAGGLRVQPARATRLREGRLRRDRRAPGRPGFDGVAVGAVDMAVDADTWGAR